MLPKNIPKPIKNSIKKSILFLIDFWSILKSKNGSRNPSKHNPKTTQILIDFWREFRVRLGGSPGWGNTGVVVNCGVWGPGGRTTGGGQQATGTPWQLLGGVLLGWEDCCYCWENCCWENWCYCWENCCWEDCCYNMRDASSQPGRPQGGLADILVPQEFIFLRQ